MHIERIGSIKSIRTLVLSENDMKNILIHLSLCVECAVTDGVKAELVDGAKAFKEGLDTLLFLNNFKESDYDEIRIELN